MKARILLILALCGFCNFGWSQGSTAAAIADRQEIEDRYRRLSADIEGLMAANAALQKRVSALADELRNLRDNQERLAKNTSTQDEIRRLSEKIQEVDKKRADDRELILKEMRELGNLLAAAPVAPGRNDPPARNNDSDIKVPDKGYEYIVQPGDTFSAILAAFNAEFKKQGLKPITMKQLLEANPATNPKQIQPGQKIFVPMP